MEIHARATFLLWLDFLLALRALGDKEYENCGNCGTVRHTSYLGQTTKKDPCADCVDNGLWFKNEDGAWKKA